MWLGERLLAEEFDFGAASKYSPGQVQEVGNVRASIILKWYQLHGKHVTLGQRAGPRLSLGTPL